MDSRLPGLAIAVTGAGVAVGVGLLLGDPTPARLGLVAALLGVLALAWTVARPWTGFLILASSTIMLIVVVVTKTRAANAFDLLMPAVVLGTAIGATRRKAHERGALEPGFSNPAIREPQSKFERAVGLYFLVAAFSLLPGFVLGRAAQSLDSGLILLRGMQGIALYPLALWWLQSERRVHQTIAALFVGGALFVIINALALASGVERAGITWVVNMPSWPINSPNEGAMAMLLLWVLLVVRQSVRPQWINLLGLPVVFFMLILTQSRSGLIAWLVFNLLVLRWMKTRHVLFGLLAIAIAIPFVPAEYWGRLSRTLALQPGSYEAYSTLVRVYGWQAAWRVFLDHPVMGVGYLCFRFVSNSYHDLPFVITTAENLFLEIATGMGIVGLTVTCVVLVRMFRLGATIERKTSPGTLGHALAHYQGPFLISLIVANLTGDNWIGMVGLGQLALWFALVVGAGHLATVQESSP